MTNFPVCAMSFLHYFAEIKYMEAFGATFSIL